MRVNGLGEAMRMLLGVGYLGRGECDCRQWEVSLAAYLFVC